MLTAGFTIAAIGVVIRAWACGHIRKERRLDTSGPYAYTRNPIYFGSFLIAVGFAAVSGVWWLAGLALIFFVSIYLPVMNVEYEELENAHGDVYREYAVSVPAFFPGLKAWKKSDRHFDFRLYLRHREYDAALGLLAAAAVLLFKTYFFD